MFENLSPVEIETVLQNQIIGHLGCHSDGLTYIVPISYAYDGEYIYCHTYEGKKLEMMRKNPELCFQVEEMLDMANWKSVIAWGNFEELTDENERSKALHILLNRPLPVNSSVTTHLGSLWPFSSDDVNKIEGVVFKILLRNKTSRSEKGQVYSPIIG